jgi:hypothetical protein
VIGIEYVYATVGVHAGLGCIFNFMCVWAAYDFVFVREHCATVAYAQCGVHRTCVEPLYLQKLYMLRTKMRVQCAWHAEAQMVKVDRRELPYSSKLWHTCVCLYAEQIHQLNLSLVYVVLL